MTYKGKVWFSMLAACGLFWFGAYEGVTHAFAQTINSRVAVCDPNIPANCSVPSALGASSVQGDTAAGATDGGNPVKVGGVFMVSPPTYTDGQRGNAQISARGQVMAAQSLIWGTGGDGRSNGSIGFAFPHNSGDPNGTQLIPASASFLFNGTSWDRVRAGPYQAAQTYISGIGTGTVGAVVGTLAGVAAKTTYICGFDVSAVGGIAAIGPVVIAGLFGGSFTYQLFSSASGVTLSKSFVPCIPASAVNTAITVTTTANATATAVDVNLQGFQQ